MIKPKDDEQGAGVIRDETVVFAIDAAQRLGVRVVDDRGLLAVQMELRSE